MQNIKFDKEVILPIEITRFTELPEVNPIPTNSIIYKTVCGLGATHSEIVSQRDSIIILPHLSIVKSKHNDPKYKDFDQAGIDFIPPAGINSSRISIRFVRDN